MKKNQLIFLVLFGIVLFAGLSTYVKLQESKYKEVTVKSGLKILFLKDDSLPFIQFSALFPKAGSDYDWEGKSGLAQLTAYMLDQGAGGLNSESLQEELNQLGTELSIEMGRQTAHFSISGLSWQKEKLYNLFTKILSRPHFESSEMEILRTQFIERRIKNLDRADFVADTLLRNLLFQGSPAGSPAGNLISLAQIKLEDVKTFYENHYLKGNPIFMIVGNFDKALEKTARDFVSANFSYQKGKLDSFPIPDLKAQITLVTNESLVQAEARLAYSLFPFPIQNPRQSLAFKLANSILGGGGTARLFYELREKRGLTYGTYSLLNLGKFYGFFDISGATKSSSVKEFLDQTLLILDKFKQEGVSLEELNAVKQTVKMRHLKRIETPEDKLYQEMFYKYYLGLDSRFLDHYTQTIDDISLEEVNLGIKEFILTNPLQIIIYGHPSIQSQLEEITNFPLTVIPFKDYFKKELNL